jgi:drug/metabolite transporter (DMT)-like permease
MIYLLMSVTSGFFMGMLIKLAQLRGEDTASIVAANYLTAALPALLYLLFTGTTHVSASTIWFGIGGGILWPGTFFLLVFGIAKYGISIASPLSRMAVVVPAIFGLLVLGETLSWTLALGLLCTLAAVFFMAPGNLESFEIDRDFLWYLPLSFLAFGTVQLWTNLFNNFGGPGENFQYITGVFVWSIPFAWAYVWWFKHKVTRLTFLIGGVIGLGNFVSLLGNVWGLQSADFVGNSAVYFMLHGGLHMLSIFLGGIFIWHEPVRRRNWIGIAASITALVLLNLS